MLSSVQCRADMSGYTYQQFHDVHQWPIENEVKTDSKRSQGGHKSVRTAAKQKRVLEQLFTSLSLVTELAANGVMARAVQSRAMDRASRQYR